jgi:hypothetical protein
MLNFRDGYPETFVLPTKGSRALIFPGAPADDETVVGSFMDGFRFHPEAALSSIGTLFRGGRAHGALDMSDVAYFLALATHGADLRSSRQGRRRYRLGSRRVRPLGLVVHGFNPSSGRPNAALTHANFHVAHSMSTIVASKPSACQGVASHDGFNANDRRSNSLE